MNLPRRGGRLMLLAALAALLVPAAAQADYAPTRGTDFFSPTSVWNAPLAADAPQSKSSSTYVNTLLSSVSQYGTWINTDQYSVPVDTVPAAQPLVKVILDNDKPSLQALLDAVPMPADARPAPGTDGHLVIWQPSTQTMWELWRAYKDSSGNWHAVYGGVMNNVNSNPGYFTDMTGATATGLALVGGLMTIQEQADGVINHALAMAIPHPKANSFVFPAQRGDGDSTAWNAIPEGTRFRLPASLNIAGLNLPRETKMIAYAAQKYGIIVRDAAGAVTLFGEDPYLYQAKNGIAPYPYLFGTQSPAQLMASFPWSKLKVVQP